MSEAMIILNELQEVKALLLVLVEREQVRKWYTTKQFAERVRKAEFTVRNWCRLGRVNARKRMSGRGVYDSWVISHAELLRFQRDGLLPSKESEYLP